MQYCSNNNLSASYFSVIGVLEAKFFWQVCSIEISLETGDFPPLIPSSLSAKGIVQGNIN